MKKRRSLLVAALLLAVAAAGSLSRAADDAVFFKPDLEEALYGKWVNPAYRGNHPTRAQKVIFYHWGYCETFNRVDEKTPSSRATFTLVDKWTDAEGNLWYREFRREMAARPTRIVFCLDRVSGDGSVLESVYEYGDFPPEGDLDPRNPRYRVMYRPPQSR